jgi:RHS repeat-associated protein
MHRLARIAAVLVSAWAILLLLEATTPAQLPAPNKLLDIDAPEFFTPNPALVDVNGDVVERFAYDPYGVVTVYDASWNEQTGSVFEWQYLHQGLRFEEATGLYHNRMREYSPTLMRFVSVDPVAFPAGDVNVYRYVRNRPLDERDPSGQDIYFTEGSLGSFDPCSCINAFHQDVCVDLWEPNDNGGYTKVGTRCYYITSDILRPYARFNPGPFQWIDYWPIGGRVTNDDDFEQRLRNRNAQQYMSTTPEQDIRFRQVLDLSGSSG